MVRQQASLERTLFQSLTRWTEPFPVLFHSRHWPTIRLATFVGLHATAVTICLCLARTLAAALSTGDSLSTALAYSSTVLICVVTLSHTGAYKQVWRYTGLKDLLVVLRAIAFASLCAFLLACGISGELGINMRIYLIFWLVCSNAIGLLHLFPAAWERAKAVATQQDRERCFVYGAGQAGINLIDYIETTPTFPYQAVGFIDDDRNKLARVIHRVAVLGDGSTLVGLAEKYRVNVIILAMPSRPGKDIRRILETCQAASLRALVAPDLSSTLGNKVMLPRNVDVKDLLKRAPKVVDKGKIQSLYKGKTVLITGAGGSIGAEICRQVYNYEPRQLILLDSCEFNLYSIDCQLTEGKKLSSPTFAAVLGSACDEHLVSEIFAKYRPEIVLHAAAFKHVPLIEKNPLAGVINNIQATQVLARNARRFGTRRFVLISSDKAVRPTNVMGASKRCCELLIQAQQLTAGNQCDFLAVRFGNVLGSSGSVIPRFLEQIERGGPVTVTHPEMVRYFMLVDEAVGLVLQASAMARGGEIFVLNMGDPINIHQMARSLIKLAGREPDREIEVTFTGVRDGEKLYEELILDGSEQHTQYEDLFIAVPNPIDPAVTMAKIDHLMAAATAGDITATLEQLKSMAF